MDAVLTTREFGDLLKTHDIDVPSLPDSAFNPILGDATGAGLMFGVTGGMMEASLRTVAAVMDPKTEPRMEYSVLRGTGRHQTRLGAHRRSRNQAVRRARPGQRARKILEEISDGREEIHFLEVMACPGGCIGGGGQPLPTDEETRRRRIESDVRRGSRNAHPPGRTKTRPFARSTTSFWASPAARRPTTCCTPTTPPARRAVGEGRDLIHFVGRALRR